MSDEQHEDKLESEVKFFNYSKGFGFIRNDDEDEDDYFVHVTDILDSDLLLSDEPVRFRPARGHKGLQALDVERLDPPSMEPEEGFIKQFNEERGFGFIGRQNKADVFVHMTDIPDVDDVSDIEVNQKVTFDVIEGRSGRDRAYRVEVQNQTESKNESDETYRSMYQEGDSHGQS